MGYSTVSALLALAVGGLIVVSLYALRLQFVKWQMEKALQMMIAPNMTGGNIFRTIWMLFVAIIIGLILFG